MKIVEEYANNGSFVHRSVKNGFRQRRCTCDNEENSRLLRWHTFSSYVVSLPPNSYCHPLNQENTSYRHHHSRSVSRISSVLLFFRELFQICSYTYTEIFTDVTYGISISREFVILAYNEITVPY